MLKKRRLCPSQTVSLSAIHTLAAPYPRPSVSVHNIIRYLAEGQLLSRHPLLALPMTPNHATSVLRGIKLETTTERNNVVFSNEFRFNRPVMTFVYVWENSVVNVSITRPSAQWYLTPTTGVTVGGAITYEKRSTLILIHDIMTDHRYVRGILRSHVLPHMSGLLEAIFFNWTMLS
ncbi:hypothetical protein TNCV_397091 [Trichonephila clavipes]|nr:hypothetical protein TNCV_397091 [Trichonephila clavipes]